MRRCFVHIGTHKTGTTSHQVMLGRHRPDLAKRGFLYPQAGIPPASFGHHNIAWEIAGDPRFSSACGTIDNLLSEIETSDQDVVLSSEDFECAAHHPARFSTFMAKLARRSREVVIVLYLRNQVDYARSLYLELQHHGFGETFDEFVAGVIERRIVRWKSWVFAFCYGDFLRQLPSGANIVVRSYDRAASIIDDFTSLLGLTPSDLNVDPDLRMNQQHAVSVAFPAFYLNRTGRSLAAASVWISPMLARAFDGTRADMTHATKERIRAAFVQSNADVNARYGNFELLNTAMQIMDSADGDHPRMEAIFSVATIRLIEALVATRSEARDA